MLRTSVVHQLLMPKRRTERVKHVARLCHLANHQHLVQNGNTGFSRLFWAVHSTHGRTKCVAMKWKMSPCALAVCTSRTYADKSTPTKITEDKTSTIVEKVGEHTLENESQIPMGYSEQPRPDGADINHLQHINHTVGGPEIEDLSEKHGSLLKKTAAAKIKEAVSKVMPKKNARVKFDHSHKSLERNFITAVRAMNEYLLKPSDLEGLRKTYRRSPYENAPPIAVYLRKEIEAKAIQIWGSKEALARELKKKQQQDQQYREHIFQVKMTAKEFRDQAGGRSAPPRPGKKQDSLLHGSGRVVLTAITINAANFTLKLLAWLYTGSHCMFSEAIHSLADTLNQLILAYGVHKSIQKADSDHPYGYSNMRYVASLVSGVGIFFFGTGLSIYHGVLGLMYPEEVASLYWAFFILGGAVVSEGATLLVAANALRKGAKLQGMPVMEYIFRAQDPLINVVLLEDIAAVAGVGIATCCMGLSTVLNSNVPDAIGSILIGGLLGVVAAFIISTNSAALVGRSVPAHKLEIINRELENDVMIRAIHDAKCIDMGSSTVRYKAEIDFDGRELTRSYLDKQDLEMLLEEMQKLKTIDEVEIYMLKHGENVIDLVGAEIDRIESQLRKKHPEIRHCDLEIL